jgi:hypothetical protein
MDVDNGGYRYLTRPQERVIANRGAVMRSPDGDGCIESGDDDLGSV